MFWNNVETKPYGYYPLGWDVKILEKLGVQEHGAARVYQGKTLFEAAPPGELILGYLPDDVDYAHPNIGEDDSPGLMAQGAHLTMPHMQWMFYLAAHLQPLHVPGLPGGLPAPVDLQAAGGRHRARRPEPLPRLPRVRQGLPVQEGLLQPHDARASEKCIGCYPAVEQGGRQTQCTITCIGKIRLQGFLSTPTRPREDNPLDYIVHVAQARPAALSAVRARAQHLLHPAGARAAGLPAPDVRLGRRARRSRRTARRRRTAKLLGALLLFGATPEISHYFRVDGDTVIGYDAKQAEIVRVPLKEPVVVRELYDERHKAYRTNIT